MKVYSLHNLSVKHFHAICKDCITLICEVQCRHYLCTHSEGFTFHDQFNFLIPLHKTI